jgi:hypothetical protein
MSIFENAFMIVPASPASIQAGCLADGRSVEVFQVVRSASAAFTAGLAWKAPRTCTDAMAARASSGVTSLAMVARPRTWIRSGVPSIAGRLEILPRIVRQPELELPARHRLTESVVMAFKLVSNGCADEVSPIGVEAVPNHEVHAPEIDEA